MNVSIYKQLNLRLTLVFAILLVGYTSQKSFIVCLTIKLISKFKCEVHMRAREN